MRIEIDTKQKQVRLLEPCSLDELQDFLKAIDPESSLSWRITSSNHAPLVLPQADEPPFNPNTKWFTGGPPWTTYCTNNELT